MRAYIDGQPVTFPNDSLRKPRLTFRRKDDEGESNIGFSGELEFTGTDYEYIYNQLVASPNALNNHVELVLEDDCCGNKQYTFVIRAESLEWCEGSCTLTASALEYTDESRKYDCLKNTLIADNWNGFKNQQHPRITYCIELRPSFYQDLIIILAIATGTQLLLYLPLLASFQILINSYNAVLNFLNSTFSTTFSLISWGGNASAVSVMTWALNLLTQAGERVIGCGRRHPSPLIRHYIQNVCDKCGMGFTSSIFTNPSSDYYNAVYFNAPVKKGIDVIATPNLYWIDENQPLLSGYKFIRQICGQFNGDFAIIGGNLVLEREDYFQSTVPWVDLTTLNSDEVVSICYSWSTKERKAYGVFFYNSTTDPVSNEAKDRWGDIVEWNSPPSPTQRGDFTLNSEFGAARFRQDGIDPDTLSTYQNLPTIGPIIQQYNNALLMNTGTDFTPKILIWEPTSGVSDARVKNDYSVSGIPLNQAFNYPMWFDALLAGNLYTNFWFIRNPRHSGYQGRQVKAVIKYNCAILNAIDLHGKFNTPEGMAKTDLVEVDTGAGQMIITGTL